MDAPRDSLVVERARLVRRNTVLLDLAQGFVQTAFPVLLVIGGVASTEITHREGAPGILWGVYFIAAAGGAAVIGRWMDRVGRRPGLVFSYVLVALSGAACALSIRAGSFVGLIASTVPFGLAVGGANLSRGAVADMYPAEHRARAVGGLLAAGTVGAVFSPLVVAWLRDLAAGGPDEFVLPWVVVGFGAVGATVCTLFVRPDPRELAVTTAERSDAARGPRALLRVPAIRTAVLASAVGQMVMVGVMGVTPTAMEALHHGGTAISLVISFHISGMFAFAPWIGRWMDRVGHRAGLVAGCAASILGALVAAVEGSAALMGIGLFTIGLGWSATYLGATAIISDATSPHERGGALGFTDLLISLTSAAAGLASGGIVELAGYRILGITMAALVAVVVLRVARMRQVEATARV